MRINKKQFNLVYKNLPVCNYSDILYSKPSSDYDFISNYLTSKIWRLNNIYSIIDKYANKIKFEMNLSQHKVYSESLRHPRLIILKSRQQGISTLWLISFFDDCIFNSNISSGLMAQGSDETELLLVKIKTLWDNLDEQIKNFLSIKIIKNNTKEFSFNNGSSVFIRTSFRSTTLQRLHISEFGKIANNYPEKAQETKTGTLQSIAPGNIAIIESTAEGDNMYKNMWDKAVSYAGALTYKDFKPIFLSWLDDPDCVLEQTQTLDAKNVKYFRNLEEELNIVISEQQKNFWVAQYRELDNTIFQEYPASATEAFMKNREGTYYARHYLKNIRQTKREQKNLFDKNLDVQVAVDVGLNDFFVLLFFQYYNKQFRIINDYYNSGKDVEHYCKIMDEYTDYNITNVILPHDAKTRNPINLISVEKAFWKFGYDNTYVLKKTNNINQDIETVRQETKNIFVDVQAQYIINCFLNYTKLWDERRQVWKNTPKHDDYSHGADAIRYMIRGVRKIYPKPGKIHKGFLV